MAITNLKTKTFKIEYRIITQKILKKISSLMGELFQELKNSDFNNLVETLYEIKARDEMYSGAEADSFLKIFEDHQEAESLRIIVQSTSTDAAQLNAIHSRITLSINRDLASSFEIISANENFTLSFVEKFKKIINQAPKRNRIVHSVATEMLVQLLAVFLIVGISIQAIQFFRDNLTAMSQIYVFVAAFLLLSNLWTYISRGLLFIRSKYYPKMDMRSKPRTRWIPGLLALAGTSVFGWVITRLLDLMISK